MLLRFATYGEWVAVRGSVRRRATIVGCRRRGDLRGQCIARPSATAGERAQRTRVGALSSNGNGIEHGEANETIADQRSPSITPSAHCASTACGSRPMRTGARPTGATRAPSTRASRATALGWAVTDFGQGNFDEIGITMFDVRNGNVDAPEEGTPYGEKIFVLQARPAAAVPFPLEQDRGHHQLSRRHADDPALQCARRRDDGRDVAGSRVLRRRRHAFTAGQVFEIPHGVPTIPESVASSFTSGLDN